MTDTVWVSRAMVDSTLIKGFDSDLLSERAVKPRPSGRGYKAQPR